MSEGWGHKVVTRIICNRHGAETAGFSAGLLEAGFDEGTSLKPDAFLIDTKNRSVVAWEVGDSHPLRGDRLASYVDLFWLVDAEGWTLRVVSVDRYAAESDVPIGEFVYADLQEQAA